MPKCAKLWLQVTVTIALGVKGKETCQGNHSCYYHVFDLVAADGASICQSMFFVDLVYYFLVAQTWSALFCYSYSFLLVNFCTWFAVCFSFSCIFFCKVVWFCFPVTWLPYACLFVSWLANLIKNIDLPSWLVDADLWFSFFVIP